MKYIMKAGTLYFNDIMPARIKGALTGLEKIYSVNGSVLMYTNPDYAEGNDPTVVGWPLCRMPRVDHAKLVRGREQTPEYSAVVPR